jgi:murein DD-endopeptidase MepM/ murein hydrolase activator NlpD
MRTKYLPTQIRTRLFGIVFVGVLFATLCSGSVPVVRAQEIITNVSFEPPPLSAYVDDEHGFSFLYPSSLSFQDWEPTLDIESSVSFYDTSLGYYPGIPEIAVTVFDNNQQLDFDEWVALRTNPDIANTLPDVQNSAVLFENARELKNLSINGTQAVLFFQISQNFTAGRLLIDNTNTVISITFTDFGDGGLKEAFEIITSSFQLSTHVNGLAVDEEIESTILELIQRLPSPNTVPSTITSQEVIATSTGYKLPWRNGVTHNVLQGWFGSYSHSGTQMRYAYDFDMWEGEEVLAVRGGTVSEAKGNFTECGGYDYRNSANRVTVNHYDGTATLYLHLKRVDVSDGQIISQGTPVGLAGHTGYTGTSTSNCKTHLHFQHQAQGIWIENSKPIWFDEYPGAQLSSGHPYRSQNGGSSDLSLTLSLGSTLKNRPVMIELRRYSWAIYNYFSSPVFTGSTTSDSNGNITNFPLTNVPPGSYYLIIKPQGWLRNKTNTYPIDLVSGLNIREVSHLVNTGGDINGDSKINIFDYNIFIVDYGTTNRRSDLNGDGDVDIFDYNILVVGYGKVILEDMLRGVSATALTSLSTPPGQLALSVAQSASPITSLTSTAQVGEIITLNLDFDTATLEMAGIDAVIGYDQCVLEPLTDQIVDSGIFTDTFATIPTPGMLAYQAHIWSGFDPDEPVSGSGNLASIPFRVIAGVPSSTTVAIRFKPGSTSLSNMDEHGTIQPFLGNVVDAILYPTGNPQRPTQSANIISPSSGDKINQSYILLQAQVSDSCNGVHQVVFYVFYDGEWHEVGTDTDGTDGWEIYWNAYQITDQIIRVKAFAGDLAGNGVETAINDNILLDRQAPSVISITRANSNPTSAASVDFTVTFSEVVTGVGKDDFTPFVTGGIAGATISTVVDTGDQTTYTVTVDTGTGDGTIRLDVNGSGTEIQDAVGNPLSDGFLSGQVYTIERTNNFIEHAIDVNAISYTNSINTENATSSPSDPDLPTQCGIAGSGKATVWYKYDLTSHDAIAIDTKNSDYDTFIAIWEGTDLNNLRFVACNDDTGGTKQSAVAIRVTGGKTYYIEIGQP